jgi:hypothetical protein
VATGGTLSGAVSSATSTTLTDGSAAFASNLAGGGVSIVAGTGRGQAAIISSNTSTTLTVVDGWTITPDSTSTYQLGGVNWSWQSGWFEFAEDEQDNPRGINLVYQPLANPGSLDMQLYFDHSTTPRNWFLTDTRDGVTVTAGLPQVNVNLQTRTNRAGWSIGRATGHQDALAYGDNYISVGLSGVQGGEPVRVYQVTIHGVQSGD